MNHPIVGLTPACRPFATDRSKGGLRLGFVLLSVATLQAAGAAAHDLADLSIEELMNESVTSVSKREQRQGDVAAAIFVLGNDDLRRSGATTVADALRLVPGLTVGTANASNWAISARGFNSVFSNKLLVLVDGRAVYSPLFSGVFWDLQQTMLEDVDRIEAIRGPGATVWGANAVNGVINVVSRSARDTQGGLIYGAGGDVHESMGGARFGGKLGPDTYYRLFGSYHSDAGYPLADGGAAHDDWHGWHGGFRVDHYPGEGTQMTWQADATATDLDHHTADSSNINTLGRVTRRLTDRSSVEIQAYLDRTYRFKPAQARIRSDVADLSAQHTFGLGERNDVIWGLGYRFNRNRIEQTNPNNVVRNGRTDLHLFSAFVQDEFKVVPDRLTLTAGIKIEHNDYTGFEVQPSVRVAFKPAPNQTFWAAAARAVRTPNAVEGKDVASFAVGAPFRGPGGGFYLPAAVGNGDPASEILWSWELGYRVQPTRRLHLDLATFYNTYRGLIAFGNVAAFVPGVPFGTAEVPAANLLNAHTYGAEVVVTMTPTDTWRLTAAYSLLRVQIQGPVAAVSMVSERESPRHQVSLRSSHDFTPRTSLDVQLRHVGAIDSVPAYIGADLRLSYRPTDTLEFSLVGENLLEDRHPEQPVQLTVISSEVPRGFYARVLWRF